MDDEEEARKPLVLDPNQLISNEWAVIRPLGHGAYGDVYHVINIKQHTQCAMKVEALDAETRTLSIELEVLQRYRKGDAAFIQLMDWGGTDEFTFIVMTLCGPDLTRLRQICREFTDSTILRLAIRSMIAIKALHETGYIHRDIKPCNFASALDGSKSIHVIDFGMVRCYANKDDKGNWWLRRKREKVAFRGTLRYCSLNMHKRIEQGRADDLWSWLYMIVDLRQPLPWTKMFHPSQIEGQKEEVTDKQLFGKDPTIMSLIPIADHLRKLTHFDRPDYAFIAETLIKAMKDRNCNILDKYDWEGRSDDQAEIADKIAAIYDRFGATKDTKPVEPPPKRTEEEEYESIRKQSSMQAEDIPGGVKYMVSKSLRNRSMSSGIIIVGATQGVDGVEPAPCTFDDDAAPKSVPKNCVSPLAPSANTMGVLAAAPAQKPLPTSTAGTGSRTKTARKTKKERKSD